MAAFIRHITADHKDIIHDLAYDFYGRRLATASSDQYVKVWDLDGENQWKCTSSWKAHSGAVWKVTWSDPEFGQILATCSFDRTATVWEELGPEGTGGERTQSQWVKKTSLVDSRTPVTDVKFAPKHHGLQLAICSSDGVVRIYEALDIMNLSQWSLLHEIANKLPCSCISWSSSRLHPPLIAVGSDDASSQGPKVSIFLYSESCRRFLPLDGTIHQTDPVYDLAFAPIMGRSYQYLAVATKSVQVLMLRNLMDMDDITVGDAVPQFEVKQIPLFDTSNSQVWRVSWNITGSVLVSSSDDGYVRLWKASLTEKWKCVGCIKADGSAQMTEKSTAPTSSVGMLERLGVFSPLHLMKSALSPGKPLP